jgi:hypothetical protein
MVNKDETYNVISDLDLVIYFKKDTDEISVLLGKDVKIVLDSLLKEHNEVALKINYLSKGVTLYSK